MAERVKNFRSSWYGALCSGKTISKRVLFDAGPLDFGMSYNGERMGVDFGSVDAVVLSHGHWDHAGGLVKAVQLIGTSPKMTSCRAFS